MIYFAWFLENIVLYVWASQNMARGTHQAEKEMVKVVYPARICFQKKQMQMPQPR